MSGLRQICGDSTAGELWCRPWRTDWRDCQVLLVLAATATAAVPGISAAGATPESRRGTAAADAELLLLGPGRRLPHRLPPLPAGVSPALISQVVLKELELNPLVLDLGCAIAPAVPHLRLGGPGGAGPARCLSSGMAMDADRVAALLELGRRWGARLGRRLPQRPVLLAECVPGGTTTAQAVLSGLGVEAAGLVSGSLRRPAHGAKAALVASGMAAASLGDGADPQRVLAALGDPMQPLAAALVLAAADAGLPVLLAGGSQMAAVLALSLALASPAQRPRLAAAVALGTTAWVASEMDSDLCRLLERIGERWGVAPLAFAADLRFAGDVHPALAAYELGFVKEGVGAGGLALLWQLSGRSAAALAEACDLACHQLLGPDAGRWSKAAPHPDAVPPPSRGLRSLDG